MSKKEPHILTINDLKTLLDGFENGIGVLNASRIFVDDIIAAIEEAGGISVRARDTLKTSAGYEGNKARIEELEERYRNVLKKIDDAVEKASVKNINLLKGESLFINFDIEGRSQLETRGINLTTTALEFRPVNFTTIEKVQDCRIDVMNAIDIATTLRHIITSDLFLLQGREEFSRETMANLLTDDGSAPAPSVMKDEAANLLALQVRQQLSEDDSNLASDAQRQILNQF
jgi:flagellin